MVPKFTAAGTSFKGLLLYLTHDADQATTAERVAWTHTLNLANDAVGMAVDEMLWTARNAELLKAEAGVRSTTTTESPVKSISLNWHPSEQPSKDEMIAASVSFLKAMGWQDHQCILVAHTDKAHAHVHLALSAINPVTGRKLDDGFEHRRASNWAKDYELLRGTVFCQQRLWQVAEREANIPRPHWLDIKANVEQEIKNEQARAEKTKSPYDPSYMKREENRPVIEQHEWELLKDEQREERLAFFAGGKVAYRAAGKAAYRDARQVMRPHWQRYYAMKRDGTPPPALATLRLSILEQQKGLMEKRREGAVVAMRDARDIAYRQLLDAQKEARHKLSGRQEMGERSPRLLDAAYPVGAREPQPRPSAARERREADTRRDALDRFGIRRGRPVPGPIDGTAPRQDYRFETAPAKRGRKGKILGPTIAPTAFEGTEPLTACALPAVHVVDPGRITGALRSNMTAVGVQPVTPEPLNALTRFGIRRGSHRPGASRDVPRSDPANRNDRAPVGERRFPDQHRSEREGPGLRSEQSGPIRAPAPSR